MTQSQNERRSGRRFESEIEVDWETAAGRREGVVSDISADGCFVLSSGAVTNGEPVRVLVAVEGYADVELAGVVVNNTPEIGFAVRFMGLSDAHREFIARLVSQS